MKRITAAIALLLLLSGCILVEDFGPSWNEAKPDICLSKVATSLYYAEFRRDPKDKKMDELARALSWGGHHYLLFKKEASDKGGRLYRFTVIHGIFQRWRLKPTMRGTFLKEYPDAPVILERDTVTITTLDDETKKLLLDLSAKPDYWEIEEQALYNPLRDPDCRFDDRGPEEPEGKPAQKPSKKH